jgi:hypothetical protein
MRSTLILLYLLGLVFCGRFRKVGSNPGANTIQVNNIGSDAFDPRKLSNWQYEARFPLIPPHNTGSCPKNIYNANCVHNGGATWNIYFGGWDGVSSCHDSVSIVVTEDTFQSFGNHYPTIKTGSVIHVNNPSAIKINNTFWLIVTTQLQNNPQLNRPSVARGTNGIDWNPNAGGVPSAEIQIPGYPNWRGADVNGGNVIYYNASEDVYHLFFVDFKAEAQHSVFHARSKGDFHNFQYAGVALQEPMKVVNDLKLINGYFLMGLHFNGPEVWHSVSKDLDKPFPPSSLLFKHLQTDDQFIVSVGFVVDENSNRLLGAIYGAGAVSSLDHNQLFGIWLQKRVLFMNNQTVWGVGDASRALGPNNVLLGTNAPRLQGNFYLYDTDYVDFNKRGTLLAVSETVTVAQGDIWAYEA